MALKTEIIDGGGSGRGAYVGKNNALSVSDTGVPPESVQTILKPFSSLMETSAGVTDMRVVGTAAAPIDFSIDSTDEGDRYIHTLAFTISDAAASLNQFGNVTPLTVGCSLVYQDQELGDVEIASALQTNFDFIQLCNFQPTFGTGTAAFLASNVSGSSEAYIPILDINDVFGMKYGLRLTKSSSKKLILRIFDNTSAIDRFDVRAFGYDAVLPSE